MSPDFYWNTQVIYCMMPTITPCKYYRVSNWLLLLSVVVEFQSIFFKKHIKSGILKCFYPYCIKKTKYYHLLIVQRLHDHTCDCLAWSAQSKSKTCLTLFHFYESRSYRKLSDFEFKTSSGRDLTATLDKLFLSLVVLSIKNMPIFLMQMSIFSGLC